MSIALGCNVHLSHLPLILLNTGNFHLTHRTIEQSLSYFKHLAVVWSDDADIVGDCGVVEVQLKKLARYDNPHLHRADVVFPRKP